MNRTRRAASHAVSTLPLAGIAAPIEVRRHPGARRMTLRVSRTRRMVVVTVPPGCDIDAAGSFVKRHLDWVRERLGNLPEPVPFEDGAAMPLRGETHRIVFAGAGRGPVVAAERVAGQAPRLLVKGLPQHAPRRLFDWLTEEARRDLDERVQFHGRRLGLRAKRIAVRDQSSRWGSCSTSGTLSFSWRLILAPPLVLDYVAAHEVAHLREMNHGPRFWALVRKTMPDMDEAKRWLMAYGMDLHRYGPAE